MGRDSPSSDTDGLNSLNFTGIPGEITALISQCRSLQTEINDCDIELSEISLTSEQIITIKTKYKNLLTQANNILDSVEHLLGQYQSSSTL